MKTLFFTLIFVIAVAAFSYAQLPETKSISGRLSTVETGMKGVPPKGKYDKVADSLERKLKTKPNDTTSLFMRSLIYYAYNQMLSEPDPRTKGTLDNLTKAKEMIEKALKAGMKDFRAKQLRAQIYSELCFRFSGDESWMFKPAEIIARRAQFNNFKEKANLYFDELGTLDSRNASDYNRRKITYSYPIR